MEHGGAMLWGLLGLILAAIIGVAFRIAHHAEVLALRLGEPYGTLILTIAAVSVEVVILIVLLQGAPNPTLARDTVFAAVMIDINGILGAAAIIGGLKHGNPKYNLDSANSFIAMLLVALDHVRYHFGIGLRGEIETVGDQFRAQFGVVLDDAVVHHADLAGGMRMRIELAGHPMRGPARVGDAAYSI